MDEPDIFDLYRWLRPDFYDYAACKGMDPDLFHPGQGKAQDMKKALAICEGCEVRRDCLIAALDGDERWGVWGGTSARQRINWIDQNISGEDAWEEVIGLRPETPKQEGRRTAQSVKRG